MKVKYDNGHNVRVFTLLDAERVKGLSHKSAELLLVTTDSTFQILMPEGYVDSEPRNITSVKKQPTGNAIFERYDPRNMPVCNADYYAKLEPGTWQHSFFVGDHRAPAFLETGVCHITFKNGERRDCYVYVRPTTEAELARATQRAQARQLAPDATIIGKKKRKPGRPRVYSDRQRTNVESVINETKSIKAAAERLNMPYDEVARIHDSERKRKSKVSRK